MRLMTVLVLSSVSALGSVKYARADDVSARADEVSPAGERQSADTVYEGVDTGGRRVKLTISGDGSQVLVRVDHRPAPPQSHWTSLIGTGGAAGLER